MLYIGFFETNAKRRRTGTSTAVFNLLLLETLDQYGTDGRRQMEAAARSKWFRELDRKSAQRFTFIPIAERLPPPPPPHSYFCSVKAVRFFAAARDDETRNVASSSSSSYRYFIYGCKLMSFTTFDPKNFLPLLRLYVTFNAKIFLTDLTHLCT